MTSYYLSCRLHELIKLNPALWRCGHMQQSRGRMSSWRHEHLSRLIMLERSVGGAGSGYSGVPPCDGRTRERGGRGFMCIQKHFYMHLSEDLCDVSVNVGISTQSICVAQTKLRLYEDGPARVLLLLLKNQNQNNLSAKYEEIPAACPWDITFTFSSPLVLIEFFISCPFNFFSPLSWHCTR